MFKYKKEKIGEFPKLLAIATEALEEAPQDFLGLIYMSSEFGSAVAGQFFTPYEVCKLMARVVRPLDKSIFEKQEFITLSEPASDSVATIIAFAGCLDIDASRQTQLWVSAWGVDETTARMCFIHLSLFGTPAEVVIGNTLSLEIRETLYTPFHFLGEWESKLLNQQRVEKMLSLIQGFSSDQDVRKSPEKMVFSESKPVLLADQVGFDFLEWFFKQRYLHI